MDALLPGFKDCRKLTLPSTTSRIEIDGEQPEASSCHVFAQVGDPHDIPRVWGQLLPKAMVTPDPTTGLMLGFMRPKYARDDREKIVAHQPWAIFDPSTGQTNRLVFDGAPIVRGPGLRVLPASSVLQDGDPLDLSAFENLTEDEIEDIESLTKVKVTLQRTTNGSGVRVAGVSLLSPTLNLGLEVETKDRGTVTIQQLMAASRLSALLQAGPRTTIPTTTASRSSTTAAPIPSMCCRASLPAMRCMTSRTTGWRSTWASAGHPARGTSQHGAAGCFGTARSGL
jgi:hypothetical protein